jgi:hypothetical protein
MDDTIHASLTPRPRQDHEHPCPAARCIEDRRQAGEKIPTWVQCCVCWEMYRDLDADGWDQERL